MDNLYIKNILRDNFGCANVLNPDGTLTKDAWAAYGRLTGVIYKLADAGVISDNVCNDIIDNLDGIVQGQEPIDESEIKGDNETSISSIKDILNLVREGRNLVFEVTDEDAENVFRLREEKKCGIYEACNIILDKIVETLS